MLPGLAIKVRPVHGDDDIGVRSYQVRRSAREALPDVDAAVAKQAIHLLDRVLGHQAACVRQRLANHYDGNRRAGHHTQRAAASESTRLA